MVRGNRHGNLGASIKTEKHTLLSGVSEKLGGNDEGPGPHQLLEAALAACTIITVQMYANRKQWNLKSTQVVVQIESENDEGTHLKREIKFEGDLSEDQKQRLLEIANRCPIHKLLSHPISITTSLT
jgi:putative redox protein